jgi:hypothetical protein
MNRFKSVEEKISKMLNGLAKSLTDTGTDTDTK